MKNWYKTNKSFYAFGRCTPNLPTHIIIIRIFIRFIIVVFRISTLRKCFATYNVTNMKTANYFQTTRMEKATLTAYA